MPSTTASSPRISGSSSSSDLPSLVSDEEVEQQVFEQDNETVAKFSVPGGRLPKDLILMVWQGTVVGPKELPDASEFLKEVLGLASAPELYGCVETLPGDKPGDEGGGRIDFFFGIRSSDVARAAARRLTTSDIKWAEDADPSIYPQHVRAFLG